MFNRKIPRDIPYIRYIETIIFDRECRSVLELKKRKKGKKRNAGASSFLAIVRDDREARWKEFSRRNNFFPEPYE